MILKPKSTTLNPRALLYRRYIGLEKAFSLKTIYLTTDNKKWLYDAENKAFVEFTGEEPSTFEQVSVSSTTILTYQGTYYKYNDGWEETTEQTDPLSLKFGNVGKYQTNRYYYVGSFDYMIKGSVEGTTTQYLKGNIIPLTSLNIKHFNDNIDLKEDDLVVIEDHLFSVEAPEMSIKMQPKKYRVYFATLNSIL